MNQSGSIPGDLRIEDIINGMYDWVRVIDRDNRVIFTNKALSDSLGDLVGTKCCAVISNDHPCVECISVKTLMDGATHVKEERIGGKIYQIMSSALKNPDGQVYAAIEVLRDITDVISLERKLLNQNRQHHQNLEKAKKLQQSLLPWNFTHSRVNLSFSYNPCESLGGDFFDIYKIDDDRLGIYIADVSGHGLPASMLTVYLNCTIDKSEASPASALEKLYKEYNRSSIFKDIYITVFYSVLDLRKKTLIYANAGHNVVPFIYGPERFQLLSSSGIPISNWLPGAEYTDRCVHLQHGDRIFLYTDGLVEMKNPENEQFGQDRLLEVLQADMKGPAETMQSLLSAMTLFKGQEINHQSQDDITMALVEVLTD